MSDRLNAAYSALLQRWPYSHQALWSVGTYAAIEGTFYASNLALLLIYRKGWFDKYKIQPQKWPDRKLVKRTIAKLAVSTLVVRPVSAWFLYLLFKRFGTNMTAPVPRPTVILGQFALFIAVNDTLFYWAHRLLHHPAIYKYIHKQHHEYKQTIGIAATYAHPVEDLLANSVPTVLGALLVGAHPVTWWMWLVVRVLETVEAHSGYDFPCSPFHLLKRMQGGAERHDFHHSHNRGCFGSFFVFWDWIMGTDRPFLEWQERKGRKGGEQPAPEAAEEED